LLFLLALNGRGFGINAHLAVNPNPYHQLEGPKLDPELASSSRDEGAPREGRTRGAVGGIGPVVTTSRHKPQTQTALRILKYGFLAELRPSRDSFLDTGFRFLLALNGRNFGINAHLAVNPTPYHHLKGPKPKGSVI
jgi:hypothetical protein